MHNCTWALTAVLGFFSDYNFRATLLLLQVQTAMKGTGVLSILVCMASLSASFGPVLGQTCSSSFTPPMVRFLVCSPGLMELESALNELTFDDIRVGRLSITNIRVSDFGVEDNGCSVTNTGSRFTIALSGISAEVAADWSRRRLFGTGRGAVAISTSESSVSVSFDLNSDSNGCPIIGNIDCDIDLRNFELDLRKRFFGFFVRLGVPGLVRSALSRAACTQVEDILSGIIDMAE